MDFLFGCKKVERDTQRRPLWREHKLSRKVRRKVLEHREKIKAALDDGSKITLVHVSLEFKEIQRQAEVLSGSEGVTVVYLAPSLPVTMVPWVRHSRLSQIRQMMAYFAKRGVPCTICCEEDLEMELGDHDAWPEARKSALLMLIAFKDVEPLSA